MNPAVVVSAAALLVGAIAALFFVFNDPPSINQHNQQQHNYNYNNNSYNHSNYHPSTSNSSSEPRNGSRNRKKEKKNKSVHHDTDCPICLEILNNEFEYDVLACNHALHKKCLNTLQSSTDKPRCPLCRSPLSRLAAVTS